VQLGDFEAIELFVRRMACVPRILSALNHRLGSRLDEHDIADLGQDTVVLVWRKLANFTGSCTLESWAYGIARLEYMNALRRKMRAVRSVRELEVSDSEPKRSLPTGEGLAREELERWLGELEEEESVIVRKKHFEGKTFEELAEEIGISPNTAKTRYYRGIRSLQQKLGRMRREAKEDPWRPRARGSRCPRATREL
jgi:RNA polymerase sigma-70 factor (ECF subfamily)